MKKHQVFFYDSFLQKYAHTFFPLFTERMLDVTKKVMYLILKLKQPPQQREHKETFEGDGYASYLGFGNGFMGI